MRSLIALILSLSALSAFAEVKKPTSTISTTRGAVEIQDGGQSIFFNYTVRDNGWSSTGGGKFVMLAGQTVATWKASYESTKTFDIEFESMEEFNVPEDRLSPTIAPNVEADAALKCQELGAIELSAVSKDIKNAQTSVGIRDHTFLPYYPGFPIVLRFACSVKITGTN